MNLKYVVQPDACVAVLGNRSLQARLSPAGRNALRRRFPPQGPCEYCAQIEQLYIYEFWLPDLLARRFSLLGLLPVCRHCFWLLHREAAQEAIALGETTQDSLAAHFAAVNRCGREEYAMSLADSARFEAWLRRTRWTARYGAYEGLIAENEPPHNTV